MRSLLIAYYRVRRLHCTSPNLWGTRDEEIQISIATFISPFIRNHFQVDEINMPRPSKNWNDKHQKALLDILKKPENHNKEPKDVKQMNDIFKNVHGYTFRNKLKKAKEDLKKGAGMM